MIDEVGLARPIGAIVAGIVSRLAPRAELKDETDENGDVERAHDKGLTNGHADVLLDGMETAGAMGEAPAARADREAWPRETGMNRSAQTNAPSLRRNGTGWGSLMRRRPCQMPR